jgi:hypothetical protein
VQGPVTSLRPSRALCALCGLRFFSRHRSAVAKAANILLDKSSQVLLTFLKRITAPKFVQPSPNPRAP